MNISPKTARQLGAARDIGAVLFFCALVFLGGRALINSPHLQKERLTRAEAAADIEDFFAKVEKVHPAPYGGLTAEKYAVLKSSALAGAEAALDEFKRIRVRDLAYILYRCAAAFGDGGTRLLWEPARKWKDPEHKLPPFRTEYVREKFTAGSTLDPALSGAELLAIDGAPFAEFIAPALNRISGETRRLREHTFCRDQALWWDFSGLLAGKQKFKLIYRTPAGKISSRELEPVTPGGFRRFAGVPAPQKVTTYTQKKLAWLNIDALPRTRAERRHHSKIFSELKDKGIDTVVLDLREAAGGDATGGEHLLSCLSDDKFFPGRVLLITGPGTGSAAAYFGARFRETKAGEILGEETGGTPSHYGSPQEFRLDRSGIRYAVSSKRYLLPGGERTLAPDLRLTEARLRPYKGNVRALVLDHLIKEKRP